MAKVLLPCQIQLLEFCLQHFEEGQVERLQKMGGVWFEQPRLDVLTLAIFGHGKADMRRCTVKEENDRPWNVVHL